jgi:amino acid transporter
MYSALKRLIVGPPIASSEEQHTRLGRPTALAVFASDAISSTAYATEELLLVLVPVAGLAALDSLTPISIVVAVLLVLVISSYRQTIYAYPTGGGSYIVSRENLGVGASLVAGASLLVDYILTVAVSISAGIAAITSAFAPLRPYRVQLCLVALGLMMLANLRGTKESGRLFAPPVYLYVVSLACLIVYGLTQSFFGDLGPMEPNQEALNELAHEHGTPFGPNGDPLFMAAGLFILLRAFSSGAVALTGIESIANGVPAFKKPESKNAAATLVTMGCILGTFFLGISILASRIKPTVLEPGAEDYQTLLSIMGRWVYGDGNPMYFILQISTFAILILAANTAFADFPRVSSIIAADGFLPRQLTNRGDRLVFSNGIVVLSLIAGGLIVLFRGDTSALIPLYAVGVFTCFTLSQAGMVIHHRRLREPGWQYKQIFNLVGAVATGIVAIVVVVSKFTIGAWIPVVLIPLIVLLFKGINRHYVRVRNALLVPDDYRSRRHRHTVIVLVGQVHRGVLDAITYARSLAPDRIMGVSIVHDDEQADALQAQWAHFEIPVELRTIYSPYRELAGPVMAFINELDQEWPDDIVTVVVPEFVLKNWWEQLLHNQSALVLRTRLRMRPNTVVTAVPIHLYEPEEEHYPGSI